MATTRDLLECVWIDRPRADAGKVAASLGESEAAVMSAARSRQLWQVVRIVQGPHPVLSCVKVEPTLDAYLDWAVTRGVVLDAPLPHGSGPQDAVELAANDVGKWIERQGGESLGDPAAVLQRASDSMAYAGSVVVDAGSPESSARALAQLREAFDQERDRAVGTTDEATAARVRLKAAVNAVRALFEPG